MHLIEKIPFKFLFFILNIIITIITAYYSVNAPLGLNNLWILSCTYAFLMLFTHNFELLGKFIGISLTHFILYFRYIIIPLYITSNNLYNYSFGTFVQESDNQNAILIMILEMICIFLVFNFFSKKLLNLNKIKFDIQQINNFSTKGYQLIILLGVLSFIVFPAIRERTNFLIAKDFGESSLNTIGTVGFLFTQASIQSLFIIQLIKVLHKKKENKAYSILFLVLFGILQLIVFWNESRTYLASMGIITIYTLHFFKLLSKKYLVGLGTVSAISLISLSGYQMFKEGDVASFGTTLADSEINTLDYYQSYFGGNHLVAISVKLKSQIDSQIDIETFFNEILSNIYFVRQIFMPDQHQTVAYFNQVFGFTRGNNSMILPTLGQSYIYFGLFGAPLLSILFSRLLIWAEMNFIKSKDIGIKYSFLLGVIWFALFPMQNLNIITSSFFNIFGITYLFALLNKNFKFM